MDEGKPVWPASRVLIYGVSGSGKSTLAADLSRVTDLPWHSVDDLTWEPGWVHVPVEEQRRRIEVICCQDRWILDTAYSAWLDVALARAQLIVGLDYPRWVSLGRLLRRTLWRVASRRSVCNGNCETLGRAFSRDSIFAYHFRWFRRKRQRMRAWQVDPAMPEVRLLRSPREARNWLQSLERTSAISRRARAVVRAAEQAEGVLAEPPGAPSSKNGGTER